MNVLLTTLHAKYVHASLALPYLAAASRDTPGVSIAIREFTVNDTHERTLRAVVDAGADIVAFSCYIWNMEQTLRIAADLKKVRPETVILLGGPEASFGVCDLMERTRGVDCVVRGEGERTFRLLLEAAARHGTTTDAFNEVAEGITFRDGDDLVVLPERPVLTDLDTIPSPLAAGLVDLTKPLVYHETSRGCPFSCAFCMSSLDRTVRSFSMERITADLEILVEAGVKTVKLVDRTFNYDAHRANAIWDHILRINRTSTFHFEVAADLLTDENIELLRRVPPGTFRFEIGVQSDNEATLARVGRKSDLGRLFRNVARLREETGVVIHLDLVAGLPHEDLPGFFESLQALLQVRPHHIQVEPLKVLKGSPMRRIAAEEEYAYSDSPPYKTLQTPWLSFDDLCRIETTARLVDLIYNSGKFATVLAAVAVQTPLHEFLAELAAFWETEHVPPHLAQEALFETIDRFFLSAAPSRQEEFRDALGFDFCLAEYPVHGRLPAFLQQQPPLTAEEKERVADAAKGAETPRGRKVRTYTRLFARDYRTTPWREQQVRLLFLYVSSPGEKMNVQVHAV